MKHNLPLFPSLLVGCGIVLLLGIAQALHGVAADNLRATDRAVCAALTEIYPGVYPALRKEFELGIEQNPTWAAFAGETAEESTMITALTYQDPMGGFGSASKWVSNGLIDGSGRSNHRIVLGISDPNQEFSQLPAHGYTELVHVEVLCSVPWGIFPGKLSVTVIDHGGNYNELYLDKLTTALELKGIDFATK